MLRPPSGNSLNLKAHLQSAERLPSGFLDDLQDLILSLLTVRNVEHDSISRGLHHRAVTRIQPAFTQKIVQPNSNLGNQTLESFGHVYLTDILGLSEHVRIRGEQGILP